MADLVKDKLNGDTYEVNRLTKSNVSAVAHWCEGVEIVEHDALNEDITFAALNVFTPKGMARAQEGHWIVKDDDGNFGVFSDAWFKTLFEEIA